MNRADVRTRGALADERPSVAPERWSVSLIVAGATLAVASLVAFLIPRPALRRIPTSVAVIACRDDETVHAATVSSLTSVSRRPALVSVCLKKCSRTLGLVEAAKSFAVSLLASDQEEVAKRFAEVGRSAGPAQFAGAPHYLSAFGPTTACTTRGAATSVKPDRRGKR